MDHGGFLSSNERRRKSDLPYGTAKVLFSVVRGGAMAENFNQGAWQALVT